MNFFLGIAYFFFLSLLFWSAARAPKKSSLRSRWPQATESVSSYTHRLAQFNITGAHTSFPTSSDTTQPLIGS